MIFIRELGVKVVKEGNNMLVYVSVKLEKIPDMPECFVSGQMVECHSDASDESIAFIFNQKTGHRLGVDQLNIYRNWLEGETL